MRKLVSKARLFVFLRLARTAIWFIRRIGFVVLPSYRAEASIRSARIISTMLGRYGSNFRSKGKRQTVAQHAINVSTQLTLGNQEVEGLLSDAVADSYA